MRWLITGDMIEDFFIFGGKIFKYLSKVLGRNWRTLTDHNITNLQPL
jgi:hypothetical protein